MAGRYAAPRKVEQEPTKVGRHADVKPSGRRRAVIEAPVTDPANTGPLHRVGKKRVSGASVGLTATGVLSLIAGAGTAAAHTAEQPMVQQGLVVEIDTQTQEQPIVADTTVIVAQPKVEVTTEAAPPPPPVEVVETPKVEYLPAPEPAPQPVVVVPPPPPAPPQIQGVSSRQTIVSAALGQLGVWQDCTRLVTNSLYAAGINFHGWPRDYLSLGYVVHPSQALPGDLIYYNNGGSPGPSGLWDHIAVYIGNGQAVHGGFNGNQTVVFSVNVTGAGPVFIRVT